MRTSPRRRKPISPAKFCRESTYREQGGSRVGMWENTLAVPVSPLSSAESRQQGFHLCHLLPDSMSGYCITAAQNWFLQLVRTSNKPMQKNPKQPGNNFLPHKQNGQASWESTQVRRGLQNQGKGSRSIGLSSSLATDQGHRDRKVPCKQIGGKQMESK